MKKMVLSVLLKMLTGDLFVWFCERYVFPPARRFVAKSDNKYDDVALKHVESFLRDMAKEYDSLKK